MPTPERTWVLLHGTPLDPDCWAPVADRLGEAASITVPLVVPAPGDTEPQRDIARRLAVDLGDGSPDVHLVGHSFGGQVAVELALLRPDRVGTLTVLCSRATPFPAFADVAAALRRGEPPSPDATIARWFTPAEVAADGPVVRYTRAVLGRADLTTWAAALDAIAGYDAMDRLGRIQAPTTLYAGELDPVGTPEAMGATAAHIPGARLEVLPGAMHMSPFTDPDALAERLRTAAAP